jgi:sodium/hydrogen antiporter
MIGSDDVLACFIAGNVFTWDDWFRLETEDDSLQPTIDMLLNVSVFMWYGAVCPWHKFVSNNVIHIFRLIPLGIMVLLFRRVPIVLLYHKLRLIHQIDDFRRALFVGFFGPIGVSAIFYLYISREFLKDIKVDGHERADASHLGECIEVVVWFLVMCSIIVHGLSIPLGKLGFYLPRTFSTAISSERASASQSMARGQSQERVDGELDSGTRRMLPSFHRRPTTDERGLSLGSPDAISWIPRSFLRAGRHIVNDIKRPHGHESHVSQDSDRRRTDRDGSGIEIDRPHPEISKPTDPRPIGRIISKTSTTDDTIETDTGDLADPDLATLKLQSHTASGTNTPVSSGSRPPRSITFMDERMRYGESTVGE